MSKLLLNESSGAAAHWLRPLEPGDCLAPAARPGFIHRNAGSLASTFSFTQTAFHSHFAVFVFNRSRFGNRGKFCFGNLGDLDNHHHLCGVCICCCYASKGKKKMNAMRLLGYDLWPLESCRSSRSCVPAAGLTLAHLAGGTRLPTVPHPQSF